MDYDGCMLKIMSLIVLAALLPAVAGAQKPSGRIFGTVVLPDGNPATGVEVSSIRLDIAGLPSSFSQWLLPGIVVDARTKTNARGRFVLPFNTSTSSGVVASTSDGKQRSGVVAPVAPFQSVELQLRPLRLLRGKVVIEQGGADRPAARARLTCQVEVTSGVTARPWGHGNLGLLPAIRTEGDGSFEFKVPKGLACTVTPDHGGGGIWVSPDHPDKKPLLLRYTSRRTTGRVVSAGDRKPIAGALIRINPAGASTRTDAAGKYAIDVPADSCFSIEAPGHAVGYAGSTADGSRRDVRLPTGHRVLGRLKTKDGQPLAGVEVIALRMAGFAGPSGMGLTRQKTAKDGSFEVWGRWKQSGIVVWVRVGQRFVRFVNVSAGDADVDLGALRLDPIPLHGLVTDPGGTPAPHVPIYAQPAEDPFGSRFALGQYVAAYTNHAGLFTVPGLVAGPHLVVARSASSLACLVRHRVERGAKPVRIKLERAPKITGRVVGIDGNPVPGVIVTASAYRGLSAPLRRMGLWTSSTTSRAGGLFEIPAVQADLQHTVQVLHRPWIMERGADAEPGADAVDIVVRRRR